MEEKSKRTVRGRDKSESAGSRLVENVSAGSASVGSASVGSASVGSASVRSASVRSEYAKGSSAESVGTKGVLTDGSAKGVPAKGVLTGVPAKGVPAKGGAVSVYLSPANHYKPYATGGCTEKQQMDKLTPLLAAELEKYDGVKAVPTTVFDADRSYTGRPEEARDRGCALYVALHSNAGGGKGACVFYHPSFPLSKRAALAVVKELNRVCPIRSNRAVQPAVYPWDPVVWNLGELREPAKYGIAPILVEHEFHDTAEGASWIAENLAAIAKADAFGIAQALGLERKPVGGDANGDGEADNLDATLILQYDAGLTELSAEQLEAADFNGDGVADNLDAAGILEADAGGRSAS